MRSRHLISNTEYTTKLDMLFASAKKEWHDNWFEALAKGSEIPSTFIYLKIYVLYLYFFYTVLFRISRLFPQTFKVTSIWLAQFSGSNDKSYDELPMNLHIINHLITTKILAKQDHNIFSSCITCMHNPIQSNH